MRRVLGSLLLCLLPLACAAVDEVAHVGSVLDQLAAHPGVSGYEEKVTAWLAERLKAAGVTFEIEPYVRFKGQPGEQATMFFRDPSGNAIEMKAFADLGQLFAR